MSEELRVEQGLRVSRSADGAHFEEALRAAVDYRGDVTIDRAGGTVTGFLFDLRSGDSLRLMDSERGAKITVPLAEVESIEFSGKDAASGKTWENWVRRYVERKLAGKSANIESDALD